ncbi:MAG: hypothetical protein EA360_00565 [Balneolaceae bacterium]|nr:MAG: hypothetical protein EA360_00565 [Balneolaceae bacterium]
MSEITFTIIFLAFLTAGFFAWFFTHKTREKERLLMIEKGMELPQEEAGRRFSFRFPWLKIGTVVTGLSLGVATAEFLIGFGIFSPGSGAQPVFMFLFGGIGMIIAHFADRDRT